MAAPSNVKVIFVTGCSKGGIGFELYVFINLYPYLFQFNLLSLCRCEKFAEAGCRVYASSRDVAKMEGFKQYGIRRLTVDVTKDEDVRQAVDFIIEEEGRIDQSSTIKSCLDPNAARIRH